LLLVSDERLLPPAVFIDFGIELCENPRQKGIWRGFGTAFRSFFPEPLLRHEFLGNRSSYFQRA
jgi:hypothetical protein